MNNLQLKLTEGTIENFLKSNLTNIEFKNEEKILFDEKGIKIVGNVHVKKVEFSDFDLTSPDIFSIKKISIEFEKINIVVSVDINHFADRKVIVTPDIPPVSVGGNVIVEGREVPDIVLWDIDLFGENPDIQLTIGLEQYLKPIFSASFKFNTNDFKVKLGIKDFKVEEFTIPDSIAEEIKNNMVEEVNKKIKKAVGNEHVGEVLSKIGDILKLIPIPDFQGLIIDKVTKSKQFEEFVTQQIQSKLGEYVLYVPSNFKLGSNDSPIELSINSPTVSITDDQIIISIDVNEL
ncbi:hypothetical protein [Priestia megaterium]|uniref:hypothetical protein n=1 Tax=Priestia megaterium TaxID=1404 RepID=UPI0023DC2D13|nr:hypothetical protein [Priestia megaterium]MDF2014672.1 hypothetical protein [Priestia megaterium]